MKRGTIAGIGFLIVFAGALVSMLVFAETKPLAAVISMGVMFFYAGMMALLSGDTPLKQKLPLMIFPVVGGGMIVIPAIIMYQEAHPEVGTLITERLIIYLLLLLFFVIGVCMFVGTLRKVVHGYLTCTEEVTAACVQLIPVRSHKGRMHYAPVWEYDYGGRHIVVQEPMASNVGYPQEGEQRTLFVNPEQPEEFRRKGAAAEMILLFLGMAFMVGPILAIVGMQSG